MDDVDPWVFKQGVCVCVCILGIALPHSKKIRV